MLQFKKHDKEDRESSPSDDKDTPDVDRALLRPDEDAVVKEDRDLDQMKEEVEGLAVDRRLIDERADGMKSLLIERCLGRQQQPEKKKTSASDTGDKSKAQALKVTGRMIEIECNDRLGKKIRVKASPKDTIGDFKKLVAAQIGTEARKIVLKKWYKEFRDHITLDDYELHDGMNIELYYR
ncbi:unnamed protein product [Umbelopsis vinacea]